MNEVVLWEKIGEKGKVETNRHKASSLWCKLKDAMFIWWYRLYIFSKDIWEKIVATFGENWGRDGKENILFSVVSVWVCLTLLTKGHNLCHKCRDFSDNISAYGSSFLIAAECSMINKHLIAMAAMDIFQTSMFVSIREISDHEMMDQGIFI